MSQASSQLRDFAICLLEMGDRASLETMQCQAKAQILAGKGKLQITNSRTIGSRSASVDIILNPLDVFTVIARAITDWDLAETGVYNSPTSTSLDFSNKYYNC